MSADTWGGTWSTSWGISWGAPPIIVGGGFSSVSQLLTPSWFLYHRHWISPAKREEWKPPEFKPEKPKKKKKRRSPAPAVALSIEAANAYNESQEDDALCLLLLAD